MESLNSMSNLNLSEEEPEPPEPWLLPSTSANPPETAQPSRIVNLPNLDTVPSILAYLEAIPSTTANLPEEVAQPSTTASLPDEEALPSTRRNAARRSSARLNVCDYSIEIWTNLVQQEIDKPPLQLQSPQLKFRGALVEYLRDITKDLELRMGTLHLAVSLLDTIMDSCYLREDSLIHIALACLSLAAKSEEKLSTAVKFDAFRDLSGISMRGEEFRELEFMVGEGVKWRLLTPTPASFALLLTPFLVTDKDMITKRPQLRIRFRVDGAKFVDSYLDITLSDVRLKVVDAVTLGCACVSCARVDLGLAPWSSLLTEAAGRQYSTVAPIARRLQKMMQMLRRSEDRETGPRYTSTSATSVNSETPRNPSAPVSLLSSILNARYRVNPIFRPRDHRNSDSTRNPSHFRPPQPRYYQYPSGATENPGPSNNPGTSNSIPQRSGSRIILVPRQNSAHQNAGCSQVLGCLHNPRTRQDHYTGRGSGAPQLRYALMGAPQNPGGLPDTGTYTQYTSNSQTAGTTSHNGLQAVTQQYCFASATITSASKGPADDGAMLNAPYPGLPVNATAHYPRTGTQYPRNQIPGNQIPGSHIPGGIPTYPSFPVDTTCPRSLRLLDANSDTAQPSTSSGFKRAHDPSAQIDNQKISRS